MSIFTTIQGKMHSAIQNDFWLQLAEAISEELEIERAKKKEKISLNDLDSLNDSDLFNLASKYGYAPNLIIDNSYEMLKSEVKSIPYRIKNKTTIRGLLFSFSQASNRLGEVYNTTFDDTNIVRVLNTEATIDNASNYIFGTPFIGVVPEVAKFSIKDVGTIILDSERTLDEEGTNWVLDEGGRIVTTKHLTTEYFLDRLIELEGINYSITPDYINFMLSEVQYNRRASNIPHVGIQVNSVVPASTFFNKESLDDRYTIPSIELQSATEGGTTGDADIRLDAGRRIDDFWFLDQGSTSLFTGSLNDFVYFVAGIGKKGLPSENFATIYDNVQLHFPFSDPEEGTAIEDVTNFYNNSVISGNTTRVNGILGRSLDYKRDTYITVPDFVVPTGDWTFNVWFNITNENVGLNDNKRRIISCPSLDFFYKEETNTLEITMFDGVTTYTKEVIDPTGIIFLDNARELNEAPIWTLDREGGGGVDPSEELLKGQDIFTQLEYDSVNEVLNIYYNGVLEATLDTTGNVGFDTTNDFFVGTLYGDPTDTQYKFNGLIDELSFHTKMFTPEEKDFIFTTKFGDHKYLANRVYRIPITNTEKLRVVTDREYFLLQGKAKGNTANDEVVYTSDGVQDSFTKTIKYFPLVKGGMKLEYITGVSTKILVTDDKNGNLVSEGKASGVIDYTTGTFTLDFFKDINVNNFVYSSVSETVVNDTLSTKVEENSFEITYVYIGVTYTGVDNGAGSITGTNITSGTIDYNTGVLAITFTNATDIGQPIRYSYTYREEDIPAIDKEIIAEYQTVDDLELTECGYENVNKQIVQYTSFPKCKFGTPNAFLANDTIIKLT